MGEAAGPERTPFVFIPEDHPRIAWALDPNWPRGPAGQGSVTTTQIPVAPGTVGPEEEAVEQEVEEEVVVEEVVMEEEEVVVEEEEAVKEVKEVVKVGGKARWLRYLWSFFPLGLLLWSFFPMSLLLLTMALAPQVKEAGKWLEEGGGDLGRVLSGWWWGVHGRFLRTWVLLAMAVEVGSGRAVDWVEEKVGKLGEALEGRLGRVVEGLFHIVWWTLLGSAVFGNLLAPASGYYQFMGLVPSAEETALRHGRPEIWPSHLTSEIASWRGRPWECGGTRSCRGVRAGQFADRLFHPSTFCWLSSEPGIAPDPWEFSETVHTPAVQQPVCPRNSHLATGGGSLPLAGLVEPPGVEVRSAGSLGRFGGSSGGVAALGAVVACLHLGSLAPSWL